MNFSLKQLINPSIPQSLFIVFLFTLIWGMSFLLDFKFQVNLEPTYLGNIVNRYLDNDYLSKALSYFFVLLNSFIILRIDNKFNITRRKNFFPFYIYFFLLSCWSIVYLQPLTHLCATLYIFAFSVLMTMYNDQRAVEPAFLSGLLLSCASLFIYEIVFLIPVFWIAFYSFKSASLRVYLASILGILTPWIILFSVVYLFFESENINHLIESFSIIKIGIPDFNLFLFTCVLVFVLLMSILIFGVFSDFQNNSIQNRKYLSMQILLLFVSLLTMIFVSNAFFILLPIISVHVCFLASYSFIVYLNKFYAVIFILSIIANLLILFYPYISIPN